MSNEKELLLRLAGTRAQLADIEAQWKRLRLESRHYTMELHFLHGYSINRLSQLSGHERNTLSVWRNRDQADGKYPSTRAGHGTESDSSGV